MTNSPHIRRITAQEWATYKDLRLRALTESPEAFCSTLAEEQARTDAGWAQRLESGAASGWDLPLLAEVDGNAVGLAWGRIEEPGSGVANLYQMWVDPATRGHGIGKLLLEAVIDWAREQNAAYLDLGVADRDSPAMRLYRRAGFKPVAQTPALRPGSDLPGLSMRLKLRERDA